MKRQGGEAILPFWALFVKSRIGEVDVFLVHALLCQTQALTSTDRVEWGSGTADSRK